MNGICLGIDRFHAGFLGPYGNTWIQTPTLDRLAAEGFVFDQFHVDSLRIESLYRSCWFGEHALAQDDSTTDAAESLAALLGEAGVQTVLATDDPAVAMHLGAEAFGRRILLPEALHIEPAESIEGTHLARCFAQLIQCVESLDGPFFVWCHLGSLGRIWDAPYALRAEYAEADDPDPPQGAEVPARPMADDEDPDLLLGISQSYAGQISLLDICLGALVDALAEADLTDNTALALVGLRGMSLGEHGHIGPGDTRLGGEQVHTPLMLRLPGVDCASARSQELVQTPDLFPTWANLLARRVLAPQLAAADLLPLVAAEAAPCRDRLGIRATDGRHAFRTPAWLLRTNPETTENAFHGRELRASSRVFGSALRTYPETTENASHGRELRASSRVFGSALNVGQTPQLFAKPDDRWEVNDVADRHADLADQLSETFAAYQSCLRSQSADDLKPLDDLSRFGYE